MGFSSHPPTLAGQSPFTLDGRLSFASYHSVSRSAEWVSHRYDMTSDNATYWGTWTWNAGGGGGAPTLTNAVTANITASSADLSVETDEGNGTLYVVVTTSATAPSAAQVKAGQDHTGTAAAFADSQAISSTGTKSFNASSLTASTTYYAHYMHEDTATNQSSVVSSASFTTNSATSQVVSPFFMSQT